MRAGTKVSARGTALAVAGLLALTTTACGSPSASAGNDSSASTGGSSSASSAPVKVGLVYSKSGPLATYGEEYMQGFKAGLDYATDGTGKVKGRSIEVTEMDDAGDPAKAVSAAKDLIGKGYKILAGSTASGVALQVAPLAEQNKVLFISGPAATDAITGINGYTFRSGRQTYQDILTAKSFIGDAKGKTVTVFAQDSAFGQANVAAVKAVLGGEGATVDSILVPPSATDLLPFASQAKQKKPDLLFVAWAGTSAPSMWQALGQQQVFGATKVVTGLDISASYPTFGPVATDINFLSHYFPAAADNDVNKAMIDRVTKAGAKPDLFTPDGFVAAQMIVHAVEAGGDDVDAMVKGLEGWSFDAPKGKQTVRAEDHAMLQPMFQAKLDKSGDGFTATLVKTLSPEEVAPPVAAKK